jgi:tetratricopeptide (TPR) repeat protein
VDHRSRGAALSKTLLLGVLLALGAVLIARYCRSVKSATDKSQAKLQLTTSPTFVGATKCAVCHEVEFRQWMGSHHQLAMQPATNGSVLGNFDHVNFTYGNITSSFFRDGQRFVVRTDGPDGTLQDYEIKYTFGVYPLQQYLIAMPGGRLQVLGIAWDSRPRALGGQRWVFLYLGQKITARDPLHWSGIGMNWNFMCADCHSTNLRKNYDLRTRTFATSCAEIDVACEACHGPGSNHVKWANRQRDSKLDLSKGLTITLDERRSVGWRTDSASGVVQRSRRRDSEREIQMCARCHARRSQIHEDFVHGQSASDDYRIALLDDDLYFPDGQIKGEVYEYGSFVQSRMFQAGVTCSDCHEPHSLRLRADGNGVCTQCHSLLKYDSPEHYFHKAGSAGTQCINCHMPTRTYMLVDPRRDHSIRIPRPDLSAKIGTPNACNNCHSDKSARWALDCVDKWYRHTSPGFQHFAEALHAGSLGAPGAEQALNALVADRNQPPIARATALALLVEYPGPATVEAARAAISDRSELVRRAAASAQANSEPTKASDVLTPPLSDPVRAVRIEAAEVLAGVSGNILSADDGTALSNATDEYVAAQELNADRPESHLNLGLLYAKQLRFERAKAELRTALLLDPYFTPAAVNLADLDRELGQEADGEAVLRAALRRSPDEASLLHALGLLMVRQGRSAAAFDLLAAAARAEPQNARYAYVYAIALNDAGRATAAISILKDTLKVHPYDRDSLAALVSFLDQAGDPATALVYAQRLSELEPADPDVR